MKNDCFSRRDFIKQNSFAGLGLFTLGSLGCLRETEASGNSGFNIGNIADMTLEQLHDKYITELFENFIPNMDNYAIDHKYGGVMCSLDVISGRLINTNKTTWFVGRGMWVYSFLYNNLEKNTRYLDIAEKSKNLLLKLQPKDNNFWPRNFSREGEPLSGPGDIYGDLFVAEGLFEFAQATGEKQYRDLAKTIIFNCLSRYDQPDYIYDINYLPDVPMIRGARVLGHWMILLSLCTQMLEHSPDTDLEKLASRCVDAIMNYHVIPEHGLTLEFINHDMTIPKNEYSQLSIVGHGLETCAFVMFEAARRKDLDLFNSAESTFKKHVDVAKDALYGGYFHTLQHIDDYRWRIGKSLWCQEEVLLGTLFLIEHKGDEWANRHFSETHAYIYEMFYNPANKFWFSGGSRKMDSPNTNLLEHYHHARQLMRGILSLRRMIDRKGKISDLFSN